MARTREFEEKEILDRAIALFSVKGYYGISMQELVDGLQLNRSSIYDTFGDKRGLFVAALKQYRRQNAAKMVAMFDQSTDVRKTLQEMFHFIVRESGMDRTRAGCFMVNASVELAPREKEVSEIVGENSRLVEEAMARALRRAQASGDICATQPPRMLARFFFNTVNGLRVGAKAGCEGKAMEDVVKVALSVLDHP